MASLRWSLPDAAHECPDRRARLRICLVLALLVFVFEHGRHSVHHLWSTDPSCVLACADADTTALAHLDVAVGRPVVPERRDVVVEPTVAAIASRPASHHQGRAPPALPSA